MERLPVALCQKVWDQIGFKPAGPEQAAPMKSLDRFPCIVGGERSGKSTVTTKIALPHVLALPYTRQEDFFKKDGTPKFNRKTDKPRSPHIVIYGPRYKETRVEFEYLENDLSVLGKLCPEHTSKPNDGAWRMVTTDGVVIETFTLENPEAVRAVTLDFALVVEAGGCPYAGIERIRGRVTTRRGFILYSGTIERSNQWWKDWLLEGQRENDKGIKSYSIPSWANRVDFPGGERDPEIRAWRAFLGEDLFLERCAAIARPLRERVVREAESRHVFSCPVPEDAEIFLMIDPGFATAYAVLWVAYWQEKDEARETTYPRIHVFDEFYTQRLNTKMMAGAVKSHEYYPRWHEGIIDVASKGNRDATDTALEVWKAEVPHIKWHLRLWPEETLIERLDQSFRENTVSIDPKCRGLLSELGLGDPVFPEMHPWKYPVDADGRILGEKPIDRWNHSAKALGYGLLKIQGQVEYRRRPSSFNRLRKNKPSPLALWR